MMVEHRGAWRWKRGARSAGAARRIVLVLLGLALPLLSSPQAVAQGGKLSQARALYEDLRYAQAYDAYQEALTSTDNRPDDVIDIYKHLGILAASMGKQDEALGHFKHLLCLQPEAKLGATLPPKVRRPFEAAQASAADIQSFRLLHTPPSSLPLNGGLLAEVELQSDSLGLARGITLRYRAVGQDSFGSQQQQGSGALLFEVPAADLPPGQDVEYFLQVNDAYGSVLWEFGSAISPIVVQANPRALSAAAAGSSGAEAGAWYEQGWLWAVVGASAAVLIAGGTTIAIVAAVTSQGSSVEFGSIEHEVGGS